MPIYLTNELLKDLRQAARGGGSTLDVQEVRLLVDTYYMVQGHRIQESNRLGSGEDVPNTFLSALMKEFLGLEKEIKVWLDAFAHRHPVGEWALAQKGIGPVLTAGLLAHFDITKAPSVSHFYSFAGLNPQMEWKKGQKRPFNARLKTLCWKIGESFVKQTGGLYNDLYKTKKEFYQQANLDGKFAARAKELAPKFRPTTQAHGAYAKGTLPPAHIHAMAKRYAVKIFLAHLHHRWFEYAYGVEPPRPYAIEHLGHVDMIPVPEPFMAHRMNPPLAQALEQPQ